MNRQVAHDIDNKSRTDDVHIIENVDFTAMLLSDAVLQGLLANGFKKPSPIQLKAIPMGRCGYDLIIQAKSGTGKTAVFGIIALEMIDVTKNQLQVLILAPTREIAVQIQDVLKSIGIKFDGLKVEYFIGGTSLNEDIEKLKNCHIAVGAPGRIKHLIKDGHMKVEAIRLFVLDEADKLLQSGQQKDINFIYNKLNYTKQMIASSATYTDNLKKFITKYMQTPTVIDPHQDVPVLLGIRQFVTTVKSHLNVMQQMNLKTEELIRILQTVSFTQCIIFCNYQTRAETLCNNLSRKGWPSIHISAAQKQKLRLEAVNSLKEFKCRILTTTDLTARGIDAANVDLVINYEVPVDCETYLHRMGRAGRYGSSGLCISIAAEGADVTKLQNLLGKIGSKLSVMKFPKENVPKDIWTCDIEQFEKLHGTVQSKNDSEQICDTLKELSVRQNTEEDTENKEKCTEAIKEVVENKNNTEIDNNVELLLSNLKKEEEISKESCKNQLDNMNSATILEMLSKGESIKITQENTVEKCNKNTEDTIDVQAMLSNLSKEEEESKNEIKNKLADLDPSSILNLLAQDKLPESSKVPSKEMCDSKIKKSKCKKAKRNESESNDESSNAEITEDTSSNEQFDNEAKLFQENTLVHRNLALYSITKVVVEQESITEDSVTNTENLLKIIEHEDNLEIKQQKAKLGFTDLLNQLGINSKKPEAVVQSADEENESRIGNWEVIRVYETTDEIKCTCSENLFCDAFDYAISRVDKDWQNNLCELHKDIKTSTVENNNLMEEDDQYNEDDQYDEDGEYNEDEQCYEDDTYYNEHEEYYDYNEEYEQDDHDVNEETEENEILNTEAVYDEDIFIKSYDYSLKSEVNDIATTKEENLDDNEACGYAANSNYDHLRTEQKKRTTRKHKKSTETLAQTEYTETEPNYEISDANECPEKTYESYFDYYDTMLAQNGPYFTDESEFETWFQQWQESVYSVRNHVQDEIYAKEKLAKDNENANC